MELREEMYETIIRSNLIEGDGYFFSASLSEVRQVLDEGDVDVILAHSASSELAKLIDLIKGRKVTLIILGEENENCGFTLISGQCLSSWHEAIPYEKVS